MSTALLAPNTNLAVGDPVPPASQHKAVAGLLWGLVPVLLGGVIEVLHQVDVLFPDAPSWVLPAASVVLIILGPVASYVGVYQTTNLLKQPVIVDPQPPEVPEP